MKTQIPKPSVTLAISAQKGQRTRKLNQAKSRKGQVARLTAGAIIGGIIPAIAHDVAHRQTEAEPLLWLAVGAFLAYSAPLGAEYLTRYLGQVKAWGMIVGLESAMVITHGWTDWAALVVLTGINAWILSQRFAND